MTVEVFPNRVEVEEAERLAIKLENPKHNKSRPAPRALNKEIYSSPQKTPVSVFVMSPLQPYLLTQTLAQLQFGHSIVRYWNPRTYQHVTARAKRESGDFNFPTVGAALRYIKLCKLAPETDDYWQSIVSDALSKANNTWRERGYIRDFEVHTFEVARLLGITSMTTPPTEDSYREKPETAVT
jgi:hypothetical protein